MSSKGRLGLSLPLSAEARDALRQRHERRVERLESEDEESRSTRGEDWEDTIPVQPHNVTAPLTSDEESNNDKDGVEEDDGNEESDKEELDDDDISQGPPSFLPLVAVNLEKLCGYVPSDENEAEQLRQQVITALNDDEDGLAQHFDERVSELFETGVAFHSDTSKSFQDSQRVALISYPEFLCCSNDQVVLNTAREWKQLIRRHPIPVVDRVMRLVAGCNRPLLWKIQMGNELSELATREEEVRHNQELLEWRTERRREQLDKLYQVRETFDHRLEVAREKQQELELELDKATAAELRRLRLDGKPGGLEALDFETSIFAFDNRQDKEFLECAAEDSNGETDGACSSDDDDDESGYSAQNEASASDLSRENAESRDIDIVPNDEIVESNTERRSRRKALANARRKKLQSQENAARRAMEQAKIEEAHAEEQRVRDLCTTPELRMIQATVNSLEERMRQIDDLLESLQDEEWADEEEGITERSATETNSTEPAPAEFSLLDGILAMTLGALPQDLHMTTQDHFKFVQQEHHAVVNEWKQHFGRVPLSLPPNDGDQDAPSTVSKGYSDEAWSEINEKARPSREPFAATDSDFKSTGVSLRRALGIAENEVQDNWDDVEDWDMLVPEANDVARAVTTTADKKEDTPERSGGTPAEGLRPGGRVRR